MSHKAAYANKIRKTHGRAVRVPSLVRMLGASIPVPNFAK